MPDRDDKKREAPISYRPPGELRDEFHARVERSGLTTNAFLNKAVFSTAPPRQSRRPAAARIAITHTLPPAAEIRSAVDRIEALAGDNPDIREATDAIRSALSEIRSAVFKANGRQP